MCGIAGVMNADPKQPVDPDTLVAMAAIQYHRGPDGFGYRVEKDRGVGFSHARLTIIDLDENRGRQPFVSHDGNLMLAVNGELYDYKRIRTELTSRGAKFRTKSDSEMVLHLYERYGLEETLKQMRGEFGVALYDRAKDRLMLIRDRFGVKPLYWTEVDGRIVFGSEIKVLFAHPGRAAPLQCQGALSSAHADGGSRHDGLRRHSPGQAGPRGDHRAPTRQVRDPRRALLGYGLPVALRTG
jgi:asparagine synthase (glutamine-hydrolysing)